VQQWVGLINQSELMDGVKM